MIKGASSHGENVSTLCNHKEKSSLRRLYVLLQIPHRYSPSAVGCDGGGGSWWQLLWGWPFRVPDFLDSVPEMPLFVDEVSDTVCVWSLSVMVIAGIA